MPCLGSRSNSSDSDSDSELSDDGELSVDDGPDGEFFASRFRAIMARGAGAHPEQPEQPAELPAVQLAGLPAERPMEQPAEQHAGGLPRDPSRDP